MDSTENNDDDVTDIAEFHSEAGETAPGLTSSRADRFYDRIRNSIRKYVEKKGTAAGKAAGFLLLVPDVFILLWRLANDPRIHGKDKVLLGSGIAYFIFPLDLVPEAIFGPIGYLDDLVLAVFILNRMLGSADEALIREHWSGDEDVFDMIRRVLASADGLVTTDLLKQIKKIVK